MRILYLAFICSIFGLSCTNSNNHANSKENTLSISIESKIPSLDPHSSHDVYSTAAEALFYESLYGFKYAKQPYEIEPILANGMPEFSKDKKKMTVKIKSSVFFHDDPCFEKTNGKGREVTADDVVYPFYRMADSKFISPVYGSFEELIIGIKNYHEGKANTISGIKIIDKYTVEFNFINPSPRFTLNLTDSRTSVVPKECVEKYGDQFAIHPVGTGAFLPEKIDLNSKIIAKKNPNYKHMTFPKDIAEFSQDAGKTLPLLDKIILEIITEKQPAWLKFLAGSHDFILIPKDNLSTSVENGKLNAELANKGIRLFRQPRADVTVMIFNLEDPVWGKHSELRQAFSLALDRKKIIEIQYSGQAIPAQSLIDPSMYGYDPEFKSKWLEHNTQKSKELLAKAGYPEGKGLPPLIMPAPSDTTQRQLTELVSRQLAEVGIVLQPEFMTWPELENRTRKKSFVLCGMGFASGTPDFSDATGILLSKNAAPGSNTANYRNPKVDQLINETESLENGRERLKKIHQILEILDQDLPYVPMVHRIGNQLVQPWVENFIFLDPGNMGDYFKYLKIKTQK